MATWPPDEDSQLHRTAQRRAPTAPVQQLIRGTGQGSQLSFSCWIGGVKGRVERFMAF